MIKISSFISTLHESEKFTKDNKEFIENIELRLNDKIIYSDLEDYDCDLKLIFIASGGSEGLFLENFAKLKPPFYFLTSGKNNSLAASLEILTYLNNLGIHGEIIHGDYDYIAKRIHLIENTLRAQKEISKIKLGVLGKPSDWLIASTCDYQKINEKFNIEFEDISLNEVESFYHKMALCNFDEEYKFDRKEVNKALRVYKALKKIVETHNLDGLTIRCFDLLSSLKTTSCLALAKLNEENIISSCEGDIMALVSMIILNKVCKESIFQANPSLIKTKENEIVLAHCTLPLNMVSEYQLDTHFESQIGVAIKGELKKGKVTIFRLHKNLKDYYLTSGEIIENLNDSNLCRSQIRVKLDSDVTKLLKEPCGNHLLIIYNDYKEEIEDYLKSVL